MRKDPNIAGLKYNVRAKLESQLRICLVTTELIGPFRNGGIGTATTGLAQWLASEDHEVTVLYTLRDGSRPYCVASDFEHWQKLYQRDWNIDLVSVPDAIGLDPQFPAELRIPYFVHCWLRKCAWDLVLFCDSSGPGYFCTQAKQCGADYQQTVLAIIAHGSHRWLRRIDETVSSNLEIFAVEDAEEVAMAYSDVVVAPSNYMMNWLTEYGAFRFKRKIFIPNILPEPHERISAAEPGSNVPVDEFVFFGRFEIRKGIEVFCDAVDMLMALDDGRALRRVTFMGRCGRIGGEHGGSYILRRSYNWPIELKFEIAADQAEALNYLMEGRRLAVMPSLADNLPSVVIECLENNIPFVAGDVGGAPELVDILDQESVLVSPNPESLLRAFCRSLKEGGRIARPAITRTNAFAQWRSFLNQVETSSVPGQRYSVTQLTSLQTGQLLDLGSGRKARVLLEPDFELSASGIQALLEAATKAPVVVSCWVEDQVICGPRLDLGSALADNVRVPLCIFDADLGVAADENATPGEVCRRLLLMGHSYLLVPDPCVSAALDIRPDRFARSRSLDIGKSAQIDAASLILGRKFAGLRSSLLGDCYKTILQGDILAELNDVDHFKDVQITTALMAGFLNAVGRRREALALFDKWLGRIKVDENSVEAPIKLYDMKHVKHSLDNILVSGGFEALSADSFMLHPNDPGEPDATCRFTVCLFGHSMLTGKLEISNRKSGAVEFAVRMRNNERTIIQWSRTVHPGSPIEIEIPFDACIGPVEFQLSTRMGLGVARNFHAWAIWSNLELAATSAQ